MISKNTYFYAILKRYFKYLTSGTIKNRIAVMMKSYSNTKKLTPNISVKVTVPTYFFTNRATYLFYYVYKTARNTLIPFLNKYTLCIKYIQTRKQISVDHKNIWFILGIETGTSSTAKKVVGSQKRRTHQFIWRYNQPIFASATDSPCDVGYSSSLLNSFVLDSVVQRNIKHRTYVYSFLYAQPR